MAKTTRIQESINPIPHTVKTLNRAWQDLCIKLRKEGNDLDYKEADVIETCISDITSDLKDLLLLAKSLTDIVEP